jgi:hypothetical protein
MERGGEPPMREQRRERRGSDGLTVGVTDDPNRATDTPRLGQPS